MTSGGGISWAELVVLGWSSAAAAPPATAPVPIRIHIDAPAGCSQPEELYEGIRARTDRVRRANEGEDAWDVRVRLKRVGSRVHGELRVIHERGATDTRTVEGTSCTVVVQALSLTAALALDEVVEETAPAPPPEPPPAVQEPPPPPPPPPPPVEPQDPPLRFEFGAQALIAQVVSPYVSLGGALVGRVSRRGEGAPSPSFDLALSPSLGLALVHARNDLLLSDERASVQWTAAALTACPLRLQITGAVSAEPCLTAAGGWLAAEGNGITQPASVTRSWWSVGGTVRAAVSLGGGAAVEIEAGASAPLVHRRFTIATTTSSQEPVGETPALSPLAGLGFMYGF